MKFPFGRFAGCACCSVEAGRRAFVSGLAASAVAAASGVSMPFVSAQAASHRIDVHHHLSPPAWVDALKKAKLDSPPVNNWSPQKSLDEMGKAGVATAITSPTAPALGFLGPAEAAAVARASNEYAKKLTQDHPGSFGVFALLPMPHVDETLKEIAYAFDTLKVDGVAFMTSYGDKYLGDPAFAPVMDELNRRKATAYTHPNNPACCQNIAGLPPVIIEYGTDTTRTIASLVFTGTTKRCPDVKFIFSHAGGTLGALTERFAVQLISMPQYKSWTADAVMGELARQYYDTAQAANPIAMAALTKIVAASQIVFGSDYPYRMATDQVAGLASVFGPDDLKKIERENALRIIPTLRA